MFMANSPKRKPLWFILLVTPILIGLLLILFGEAWIRRILLYLSTAVWARTLVSRMSIAQLVARRFVAGENIKEALTIAAELNQKGMHVTMDYLGESVTNTYEAIDARDEILNLLDAIHNQGLDANVSVKLSQLGLKLDSQLAFDNMHTLLQRAQQYNNKIRIDMEEHAVFDVTMDMYRSLRDHYGYQNTGVVIQAYLHRNESEVQRLIAEGAWVRLCKGAYMEPPDLAFPEKADTDKNYIKLMQMLLSQEARDNGVYVGVATHDEKMIQATIDYAKNQKIAANEFEFQMLYGIRRELQTQLVEQGHQLRIYVPYGAAWYPYFVRRLAERPANLWFFISNLLRN